MLAELLGVGAAVPAVAGEVAAVGHVLHADEHVERLPAQRRGVYDLTRVNAERAPDYGRVDVRVDRTFTVGGQPLNLFLGVQNVINRRNFASYSWNRRTNAQQFGEQQGIFPIVGFDWRF